MKKSEKILLVLVGIAVLYGVLDFSLGRQKKKATAPPSAALTGSQTAVADLSAQLGALNSANDIKIDQLATTLLVDAWSPSVFALRKAEFAQKPSEQIDPTKSSDFKDAKAKVDKMVYSGFLAMGGDRIAIIDGMDYRVGDEIDGLAITRITKDLVEVQHHDNLFEIPAVVDQPPPATGAPRPPVDVKSH